MLVGVTVASLAAGTADPLHLAAAAISSQLPDVDTSRSLAGHLLPPLSRLIERRFPHRTLTHSLAATLLFAVLAWPLCFYSSQAWKVAVWGYFCGWFADAFTKSGVAAFYPLTSARLVIPANPRLRLASGSRAEHGIVALFLCLLAAALHLNTQGGLMRTFSSWLGQPEAVAALFAREGARRLVQAEVEGRLTPSSEPVRGLFEVVEVIGEGLLVRAQDGAMYLAGRAGACPACQIQTERVRGQLGTAVSTSTRELRAEGRRLRDTISGLRPRDGVRVWLTGEVTLEGAELLVWPTSLSRYNSVVVTGGETKTLRLQAATPEDLRPAADYFCSGRLLVKEVVNVR